MDFFSSLDSVREKPEIVRKNIAFWVSAGITFFIFLIWVSFLAISPLGSDTAQTAVATQASEEKNTLPSVNEIGERLWAGVQALLGKNE